MYYLGNIFLLLLLLLSALLPVAVVVLLEAVRPLFGAGAAAAVEDGAVG